MTESLGGVVNWTVRAAGAVRASRDLLAREDEALTSWTVSVNCVYRVNGDLGVSIIAMSMTRCYKTNWNDSPHGYNSDNKGVTYRVLTCSSSRDSSARRASALWYTASNCS